MRSRLEQKINGDRKGQNNSKYENQDSRRNLHDFTFSGHNVYVSFIKMQQIKQEGNHMPDQNEFNDFSTDYSVMDKMEDIFLSTCGTWQNCNESNIQTFLSKCEQENIDPQFCMNWIQDNHDKIPNWPNISDTTREWVIEHTSTGSPISGSEGNTK